MPNLLSAIETYFDALYECNLEKFDQVFHSSSSLFDSLDGTMTAMPIAEYRAIIEKRVSPSSVNQTRKDEIITLDWLSPTAAVVKVKLQIHDKTFIDHLNFALCGERFMIVAKIWHDVTHI